MHPASSFHTGCSLPRDQIDSASVGVRSIRTAKRQSHITDHEERAPARIRREHTSLTETKNDLLFRLAVGVLKEYREKLERIPMRSRSASQFGIHDIELFPGPSRLVVRRPLGAWHLALDHRGIESGLVAWSLDAARAQLGNHGRSH